MSGWLIWLKEITFARPQYLNFLFLWLVAVIGIVAALIFKRLKRPRFARDSKQKTIGRDMVWILASCLAGLMIVALAGPKSDSFKMLESNNNLNIIFAADKSVSMAIKLNTQENLSRHDLMIKEITTFISSPAVHEGDRLTLFTFSEKSDWRMPFSDNRDEFLDKLQEIEQPKDHVYYDRSQLYTYYAGLLIQIPNAMAKQDDLFKQDKFKGLVTPQSFPTVAFIFSDGESIDDSLAAPLAYLAKKDIKVYTVGVGTLQTGTITIKIPSEHNLNQVEEIEVRSQLNMKALDLISAKTGGKSYVASSSSTQVQSFMATALTQNRKPTLTLVRTGDSKNFWWDVLAIPSFIIVLLMAITLIIF